MVYVIQVCAQLSSRTIVVLLESCIQQQTNCPKHVEFHDKINL